MSTADQDLVLQSRQGQRDAFAEIVRRYQNLVCSVAYAATGSLSVSEELAQEAFVTAWRSLDQLREPDKLKAWLTGIVRNLARNSIRKESRNVLGKAGSLSESSLVSQQDDDPVAASIAAEEASLISRSLEALPEAYREPLILYYREDQSVARVAELLELSPDAVKQRLSRGRKLLRSEIAAVVERGLELTTPGRAFTLGVLAALPVVTGTAKAATLTVTGAKGASAMNAAGWLGVMGAVMGPIAGLAGGWFGFRMSLKAARSDRERRFIKRQTVVILALVVVFTVSLTALALFGARLIHVSPMGFAAAVTTLVLGYVAALLGMIVHFNRRQAQIQREEGTLTPAADEVAQEMPAALKRWQYPAVYESPTRLLGLPLVAVRFNGVVGDPSERRPAIGWIAVGDCAIGVLYACGAIAVGGIAFGGVGLGVFCFAGLAIGLLSVGGASIGLGAVGGVAAGLMAFGGLALGWFSAMGGLAVARDVALGGLALAENANNEVAKQLVAEHWFFQTANLLSTHGWIWLVLIVLMMLPMFWARRLAESSHPQPE